jgi:threonine dehydratase
MASAATPNPISKNGNPKSAVEPRDLYLARRTIAALARRTPLVHSVALSERTGAEVHLKLETAQETGSFKLRGAANRLVNLTLDERSRGVITVSTGNHGKAVAFVARKLGVPATICVPEQVLAHKVAAIRKLGATVVTHGASQDEAEAHAAELSREQGLVWVSAFDDPWIIAGQGTIGLEILEELPNVDTLIVPLSGGGLIAGIALAAKTASAAIRTVGVTMERGPAMAMSMRAGHPVTVVDEPTLADSLMGGIGLENRYTFAMVQRFVDEVALVSEQAIAAAMAHAVREERVVVEGGGAVGIAALLAGKVGELGRQVVVVLSGANVDMAALTAMLAGA